MFRSTVLRHRTRTSLASLATENRNRGAKQRGVLFAPLCSLREGFWWNVCGLPCLLRRQ